MVQLGSYELSAPVKVGECVGWGRLTGSQNYLNEHVRPPRRVHRRRRTRICRWFNRILDGVLRLVAGVLHLLSLVICQDMIAVEPRLQFPGLVLSTDTTCQFDCRIECQKPSEIAHNRWEQIFVRQGQFGTKRQMRLSTMSKAGFDHDLRIQAGHSSEPLRSTVDKFSAFGC